MNSIVIALGGNALQQKGDASAAAQERVASETAAQIIPLLQSGYKVVIVHGNGPQVGNIVLHEEAINTPDVPSLPLDSSVAMSQGLIGYWLQNALQNELTKNGLTVPVVTLLSQTVVGSDDPAFLEPTKPIGPFYDTEAQARIAAETRHFIVKEDAGRGWRRVVPSPKPLAILEQDVINALARAGVLVIAAGGGGVPVIKTDHGYEGIEAVIDKDFSAAVLAGRLDADVLLILTSVEAAMINFGTPQQIALHDITVDAIKQHVAAGHFAPGSMLPKVLAAVQFVEGKVGRRAVISSLSSATAAVAGTTGTVIHQ
ncbi:carbamate kinase [Pedobacter sp.]|nr:carbamate kinase [Candidatus Saccharibacteria bacterium]